MTQRRSTLEQAFESQLQNLALTLRPGTVVGYRRLCKSFLGYLREAFPEIRQPCQLCRTPHIVGWLRSLHQRRSPLSATTRAGYIIRVRRVLADLTLETRYQLREPLFVRGDIPPQDICLPKPLSPEDDARLQEQLRQDDDLYSNAFLLIRLTGLRIGEGRALRTDSLHHLGGSDWALRVPLGKLHNERWVPVDEQTRTIFSRILELRTPALGTPTSDLLLREKTGQAPPHWIMSRTLAKAARRAGCSSHITPHRLRHTFATSMLRAGVNILAVKEMLGHRSLAMTMRYVQVSQVDLQREYHAARQKMPLQYSAPKTTIPGSGISGAQHAIGEARRLLEMLRRDLDDTKVQLKLHRLTERLTRISAQLTDLGYALK